VVRSSWEEIIGERDPGTSVVEVDRPEHLIDQSSESYLAGATLEREPRGAAVIHPRISVGTPKEYAYWESRIRKFLVRQGTRPDELDRVDARYNFKENRVILYRLARGSDEWSVSETISHELLHALLDQLGERYAARAIDLVAKPVGNPARVGGV
jgi:hypothetical protein